MIQKSTLYADNKLDPVEEMDPFAMANSQADYRAFGAYDMNRHFVDCIVKGKQPETCFDDALKTMELIDAIYQSQLWHTQRGEAI